MLKLPIVDIVSSVAASIVQVIVSMFQQSQALNNLFELIFAILQSIKVSYKCYS